jgi:hypothetical protein
MLLNWAQRNFLTRRQRRSYILKARQLGFSTACLIDMLDDTIQPVQIGTVEWWDPLRKRESMTPAPSARRLIGAGFACQLALPKLSKLSALLQEIGSR